MRELQKVLDENEKILWEGRPQFLPFVFQGWILISIVGILWTLGVLSIAVAQPKLGNLIFITPHFWIGIVMIFGYPLQKLLVYERMYYTITDKRVIIQKGIIGRDFRSIDFDKITDAEVNVGFMDKLFSKSSGSILIFTPSSVVRTRNGITAIPNRLSNIRNPYEVFKLFKKTSHDVKTDISYPNKFRPKENPGYKTTYSPHRTRK